MLYPESQSDLKACSHSDAEPQRWLEIESPDRWTIYRRLQELDIACECQAYKPLRIDVRTALEAIQVWSVVRQCHQSRQQLAAWLEQCFALSKLR